MTLGERIAGLRRERGLSQEELGALVGYLLQPLLFRLGWQLGGMGEKH